MFCKTSFLTKNHICVMKNLHCNNCCLPLAKETTIVHKNLPFNFCYSLLQSDVTICSCWECKNLLQFTMFFKHKNICKLRARCLVCKRAINYNKDHNCNLSKTCYFCKEDKNDDELHFCKLSKQNETKVWPKLIFFDFLKDERDNSLLYCHIIEEFENCQFRHLGFQNNCKQKDYFDHNFEFMYDEYKKGLLKS